jgi:hypothetical protein
MTVGVVEKSPLHSNFPAVTPERHSLLSGFAGERHAAYQVRLFSGADFGSSDVGAWDYAGLLAKSCHSVDEFRDLFSSVVTLNRVATTPDGFGSAAGVLITNRKRCA